MSCTLRAVRSPPPLSCTLATTPCFKWTTKNQKQKLCVCAHSMVSSVTFGQACEAGASGQQSERRAVPLTVNLALQPPLSRIGHRRRWRARHLSLVSPAPRLNTLCSMYCCSQFMLFDIKIDCVRCTPVSPIENPCCASCMYYFGPVSRQPRVVGTCLKRLEIVARRALW